MDFQNCETDITVSGPITASEANDVSERLEHKQIAIAALVRKRVNRTQQQKVAGVMRDGPVVLSGGPKPVRNFLNPDQVQAAVLDRFDLENPAEVLQQRVDTIFDLYGEVLATPDISRIPEPAVHNMLETCVKAATDPGAKIVLNVGYGGSDDPALLRTPSYIVPALRMLEVFKKRFAKGEIQAMPTLRVFQATRLAHLVNTNLDGERVDRYAGHRRTAVEQFVSQFADTELGGASINLSEHVIIEDDRDIVYPTESEAADMFDAADFDDHHRKFFRDKMLARAGKRVTGENTQVERAAKQYIASHLAVFMDVHAEGATNGHRPETVVSFGSQGGETPFSHFREALARTVSSNERPTAIRLGQKVGDHPPYYQQRQDGTVVEQDVSMADFTQSPLTEFRKPKGSKEKAVTHDLKVQWEFIHEQCRRRGLTDEEARREYEAYCRSCAC